MWNRLTSGAKLFIILLIVGGLFATWKYVLEPKLGDGTTVQSEQVKEKKGFAPFKKSETQPVDATNVNGIKPVINIGVVTWGGYAGGQYFNEGFLANTNSRFYKNYGFKVNFVVIDDFDASRDAFKNGKIDLLWATIDALPTEMEGLAQYDPQVAFQADWSRGGDACVVIRGINSVADLKGKTIAVAPMTPSHSFLLWLLDAGGLTLNDVTIKEVPSAIDAADAFKAGTVHAAIVWSPDDVACKKAVPGAKILINTKSASHIIADVFVGKKQFIQQYKGQLQQLYEGWMIGASEINTNAQAKQKAAKILAQGLNQPESFCLDAINNVRLATHGDNLDFFGMNPEYRGVTGEELYNKMKIKYDEIGYKTANARSWRLLNSGIVSGIHLTGSQHDSEAKKVFKKDAADVKKEAIASKKVSISFRTGEYQLDDNAKQIIDMQLTSIAKAFSNGKIRIEGNTDTTGSYELNMDLSKKRAQSVANYLIAQYGMSAERFVIVGNGPNKPVANNNTESGRARNRRTDFEIIPD